MRHARIVLIIVLLAGVLSGITQAHASPPEPQQPPSIADIEKVLYPEYPRILSRPTENRSQGAVPAAVPDIFSNYRTSAEVLAFLNSLENTYPDLSERFLAGISWQGRFIAGIRLGNEATGDPDTRPAFYLDGQHHAREAIAGMSVLYTVWWLLSQYGQDPLVTHLLDTKTVYAIPIVNVDGNDIWLKDDFNQRRNANPTSSDDDGDGKFDEDPANSMGYGTFDVYRYTFDAQWASQHPNDPLAPGWQSHLLGMSDLGIWDSQDNPVPQIDDDGDNYRTGPNEDPVGGVDLNRNYDVHWDLGDARPSAETYRGTAPWSELESKAVRDWVDSHTNVLVAASLHSGADVILHPWGWSQFEPLPDGQIYEHIARKGSQLTECCGFAGASHTWTARGLYITPGSAMDWMYEQGIYAFTPETYAASSVAKVRRDPADPNSFFVYTSMGTAFDPEPGRIVAACERWRQFLYYLLAATPSVSFTDVKVDGASLVIRVANEGGIPVDVTLDASFDDGSSVLTQVVGLRGREFVWRVPLPSSDAVTVNLTASAQTLISTGPRVLTPQTLSLKVEQGTVQILAGDVQPFADESAPFGEGGWDADERRWEEGYHIGPEIGYRLVLPVVLQ